MVCWVEINKREGEEWTLDYNSWRVGCDRFNITFISIPAFLPLRLGGTVYIRLRRVLSWASASTGEETMTSESGAREKEKQGGQMEGEKGESSIPAGSLGTNGKSLRHELPHRSVFFWLTQHVDTQTDQRWHLTPGTEACRLDYQSFTELLFAFWSTLPHAGETTDAQTALRHQSQQINK